MLMLASFADIILGTSVFLMLGLLTIAHGIAWSARRGNWGYLLACCFSPPNRDFKQRMERNTRVL